MTGAISAAITDTGPAGGTDWLALARELGPAFASRAAAYDANDSFPLQNYQELKERRAFAAGVPAALGGGGASHAELCALLRELGRHCGATALALSMHLHLVATMVWSWRQGAPLAPLLARIAADQLVLTTTDAPDWLEAGGTAEPVEGGYRVSARMAGVRGASASDLLLTSAVYDNPTGGPTVLHVALPLQAAGVTLRPTGRTMGMRACGVHEVVLDGVCVPAPAVAARRPEDTWAPLLSALPVIGGPLVMAVYLGVAEAARDLAVQHVAEKREDADVWSVTGAMENALVTGQLAVQALIALCADYTFTPDVATANAALIRKTIAAQALQQAVETALETVGRSGLLRGLGLERLVRDIHAAQFHQLPTTRQRRFSGRVALGLDPLG